jgi:chorismate dehydratase
MIRVGAIRFVNTLPLFMPLEENIIANDIQFTWGHPQEINNKLKNHEVDVAVISSAHFLDNRFQYILLSDLGVATTQKVMSVRLFYSKDPFLDKHPTIYVPFTSSTSTRLLRVLCECCWSISPKLIPYSSPIEDLFKQEHPFLLFGDECLQYYPSSPLPSIDLAESWFECTKKCFLFSLIATRSDTFQKNPTEVIAVHRLLEEAYLWSESHRDIIIQKGSELIGSEPSLLAEYYSTLEYRLSSKHFHGLHHFLTLESSICPQK